MLQAFEHLQHACVRAVSALGRKQLRHGQVKQALQSRFNIGLAAGKQKHIHRAVAGSDQVAIARHLARAQSGDVGNLGGDVQTHHAVAQANAVRALQHALHQTAKLGRGLVAAGQCWHEGVQCLRVVGIDGAVVALAADVLQQLQQTGKTQFTVKNCVGAQLQQGLFVVRAQFAGALAHHDFQGGRARQAQVVYQARTFFKPVAVARVDQYGGTNAMGSGRCHAVQRVHDLPVRWYAVLLGHCGPGGNHGTLVWRLHQDLALALGAAAVVAQLLCLCVQRQAQAGLEDSPTGAVPTLKEQRAVVCAGGQGGDVHGHAAQLAQHGQHIGGWPHAHGRWWAKPQYDRLLALQAPQAQLLAHAQ